MNKEFAADVSERLSSCPGLQAVVLGGSLASGSADAASDIDLGLYYDPARPLDLATLSRLVAGIDDRGPQATVTEFGEWGEWVNGGAWLRIDDQRVDLLYRDLERVSRAVDDCRSGLVGTFFQVGHPAGFSPQIYAGEVHLCRPLWDSDGVIAALKGLASPYPPALRSALVEGLGEAEFLLVAATKSAGRGDVHHVAGSAFRSVACMVQALFGLNETYWTNEKGSVSLVDTLPIHPKDFARR